MPCSAKASFSSFAFMGARVRQSVRSRLALSVRGRGSSLRADRMESAAKVDRTSGSAVGVYGWGVVAPGARDVRAFGALLEGGGTALVPGSEAHVGQALFPVGDPDFSFDD